MDHPEADRTPSTSSAHSEMETITSAGQSKKEKFKLKSPLGGTDIEVEWDSERPPVEKINVLLYVIQNFAEKFTSIQIALQKNKDKEGNDRPISLYLPDPNKPLNPSDETDAVYGNTSKERYYNKLKRILEVYNTSVKTFKDLWSGATMHEGKSWCQDRCDPALLTFICNITSAWAVPNQKTLNNHYAPFTSEVYGETSLEQMQLLIEQLNFNEHDVFLDLGSGIGHLVLYVAGGTKVKKSIGIEVAKFPADCAAKMKSEWVRWMNHFKKKFTKFELHKGDFLSPEWREAINSATIIFINNYAFQSDLEQRIKQEILNNLNTGVRVISTKPYCDEKASLSMTNMRHGHSMNTIMDMVKLKTVPHPVSWTGKVVDYHLHTINQTKLQEYWDAKKKTPSQESSRRQSLSSKSSVSSREGSTLHEPKKEQLIPPINPFKLAVPDDDFEGDIYGPTTRKKWKEQTGGEASKKRKTSPAREAWDAPDREYMPAGKKPKTPASKPIISVKKEKKPKKNRLSDEAASTLDTWHEQSTHHRPLEHTGPGLQKISLKSPNKAKKEELNPNQVVLDLTDPIDNYTYHTGKFLREFIARMGSDELKQEIINEITFHQQRNAQLKSQLEAKKKEHDMDMASTLENFRKRLNELGTPSTDNPSELLNHSKRIVADHKELTQSVSQIEAEVAQLSGKTRTAVPYGAHLLDNIHLLDDLTLWDQEKGNIHSQYITRIAVENGHQPPREPEPEMMNDGIMSPTGPRQRRAKPRNGPGGRKGKQEENSEELDRQVQEFVQVALHVDQQAKERERKARAAAGPSSTEKSSKKSATGIPHEASIPRSSYPAPYNVEISRPDTYHDNPHHPN